MLISGRRWNTIVSNQRLGEDEDLSTVRRVSHRLGVSNEGGCEDGFAGNVRFGAKGFAMENWAILRKISHHSPLPAIQHTLIVNVARSWEIGVARGRETGIARPALPSTVARNRACWAIRFVIPKPAGLKAVGFTNRANIVWGNRIIEVDSGLV